MLDIKKEEYISKYIVGVDEVGRGPLAGPVISAAVILNKNFDVKELNDSKKLTKNKREQIYHNIISQCEYKIGFANVSEIDKLNILQASLLSMKRAVEKLNLKKEYKILVDGPWPFDKSNKNIIPCIKGDATYPSIAAASIVAKVYRDNYMLNLSKNFSHYLWEQNSGYGTKKHLDAIKKYGICEHHRKSFGPIHKMLSPKLK